MIPNRIRVAFQTPWQRTLYIMFFAQIITAVGYSSIFPFLPLYVKALGASTSLSLELLSGLVYSSQAFTMMIASPIWGTLADRFGRKLMVQRSLFGGALILPLMAFARSAEDLIILRAVQGLITGTMSAANALVSSEAPNNRTGYAMGLLQVGLGSGIALGPLIGGVLADAFGYSYTFFITAGLLLLAAIIVKWGVEENFDPTAIQKSASMNFISSWLKFFSMPGMSITYGLRFINQLGRMMVIPILPLFAQILLKDDLRINTFTGLLTGLLSITSTFSAIYLGQLGDRIGHRKILRICLLLVALLFLPYSILDAGWQLLLLQASMGVALGGIIPAISALLVRYSKAGIEGSIFGLDNSINAGARTIAPLLGSFLAVWLGIRSTFLAVSLIYFIATTLAFWFLPETASEKKSTP